MSKKKKKKRTNFESSICLDTNRLHPGFIVRCHFYFTAMLISFTSGKPSTARHMLL